MRRLIQQFSQPWTNKVYVDYLIPIDSRDNPRVAVSPGFRPFLRYAPTYILLDIVNAVPHDESR